MKIAFHSVLTACVIGVSASASGQGAKAPNDPQCERPLDSPKNPQIASPASLSAAPADPAAYFYRHEQLLALRNQGKLAEAVPIAQAQVLQYACDAWVWTLLGDGLMAANRPREATQAYIRAMEIAGPGTPAGPGYRLAVAYMTSGDSKSAMDVLEELVFKYAYRDRRLLYSNPAFASLQKEPRFLRIAGRFDTTGWTRNEGWTRDLDYLVEEVRRVDPVYSRIPLPTGEFRAPIPLPKEFTLLEAKLRRDIPGLSDEEIYVGFARLLASLKQGHTGMLAYGPPGRFPFTQLPFNLWAFPDGLYVVKAGTAATDLVGGQLLAIENTPALEVFRKIREIDTHESGMEVLWTGPTLLRYAQILKGLGVVSRTDRIAVTVRRRSGEIVRRVLDTVPIDADPNKNRPKLNSPPGVIPPLFLRNVSEFQWSQRISDNTLFVQMNQVQPDPDQSIADFALELRRMLREQPIRNVILDLRNNNGGNTTKYPELLRTLIQFTADDRNRLYVMIGRWTYSAAANLATDLQRLAHPIFVGEPTSQTGNQFGDNSIFLLPYSRHAAAVTCVVWQLSDPFDKRAVITPQVPVQLTAKAYFAGQDPALETIQQIIAAGVRPGEMDPR